MRDTLGKQEDRAREWEEKRERDKKGSWDGDTNSQTPANTNALYYIKKRDREE